MFKNVEKNKIFLLYHSECAGGKVAFELLRTIMKNYGLLYFNHSNCRNLNTDQYEFQPLLIKLCVTFVFGGDKVIITKAHYLNAPV